MKITAQYLQEIYMEESEEIALIYIDQLLDGKKNEKSTSKDKIIMLAKIRDLIKAKGIDHVANNENLLSPILKGSSIFIRIDTDSMDKNSMHDRLGQNMSHDEIEISIINSNEDAKANYGHYDENDDDVIEVGDEYESIENENKASDNETYSHTTSDREEGLNYRPQGLSYTDIIEASNWFTLFEKQVFIGHLDPAYPKDLLAGTSERAKRLYLERTLAKIKMLIALEIPLIPDEKIP